MLRKFTLAMLLITLVSVFLQSTVFAATITVDPKNPEFTVDTQQDLGENSNIKENAFDGDPNTRWAANADTDDAGSSGSWSGTEGNQSVNIVSPFDKEYTVNSMDIQFFNSGGRMYCFNVYVSNDNKTWTEVELAGDATKSTYTHSTTMVSPVDCYILPACVPGDTGSSYSQIFNVKFATPTNAKYVKVTGYGFKNEENGDGAGTWFSIVELKFDGEEVVSTATATTSSETPKTGDIGLYIFGGLIAISLIGIIITKNFSKIKVKA